MIHWLVFLFGCRHENTTWPRGPKTGAKHVTCNECGKELPYHWEDMQRGGRREPPITVNRLTALWRRR